MGSSKYHYSYITIISRIHYRSNVALLPPCTKGCSPLLSENKRGNTGMCGAGVIRHGVTVIIGLTGDLDSSTGDLDSILSTKTGNSMDKTLEI